MDIDKLKRLRERYLTAKGGDMFDPHFAAIAEAQFKDGDKRKWPFADPATFLAAPLRASNDEASNIADVDIALIGVPMDLGVTNRAGARLGRARSEESSASAPMSQPSRWRRSARP